MTLTHLDVITDTDKNSLRVPLRMYFARAVYVLSGAASGVALSWTWLTGEGLLPIVVFVPSM
jgi:hypothetical protein